MPRIQQAEDPKPRGYCEVCYKRFRPATQSQWDTRWKRHRFSKRHKKSVLLAKVNFAASKAAD